MSDKKSLSTFRPKTKTKFIVSKPSYLIPFNASKILIQQNRKAQTPTRKIAFSPSLLRGKSKTPVDNKNPLQSSYRLNRQVITTRSNEKTKKLSLNHSQSITIKRKNDYNLFNMLSKKNMSTNGTSEQEKTPQSKKDTDNKYIHVNVNVKSPKSQIVKRNAKIKDKPKAAYSLPLHRKTPSASLTLSSNNTVSLQESRNYNYSTKSLIKKLEDNQKLKEKLLANSRSPSAKNIFTPSHSIKNDHKTDKIKIKKRILSPTLPNSPTYIENKLNSLSNTRNSANKGKPRNGFSELTTSPNRSTKGEIVLTNTSKTSSNLKSKKVSKSPLTKNHSASKNNITVSVAHSYQNPIKINKTLKEYPNHVNLINKANSASKIVINKEEPKKISVIKNGKKISQIDSLSQKGFAGQGVKKENQDRYFIHYNLNNETSSIFMGVCDGHGLYGHEVSEYLSSILPKELDSLLKVQSTPSISDLPIEEINTIITNTFIKVNSNIILCDTLDTSFSGSTCSSLIITPSKLICANAGDSRCVIGKQSKNGEWSSCNLSRDHKPTEPDELKRILASGGRIEAYKDQNGNHIGPERVWVAGEDVPGLAMSRSFGDDVAQSVGVIAVPEIVHTEIKEEDKFIVIASDGIWEFISSDECVKMIKDYYIEGDISGALKMLYKEASKRWIMEEEVIDDITVIIVFFE